MKPCIVVIRDIFYKYAPWLVPLTYISRSINFVRILCQIKYFSVFLCTYDI